MKNSILITSSLLLLTSQLAFAQTAYVDGKTKYDGFVYGFDNSSVISLKTDFVFSDTGDALKIVLDATNPNMDKLALDSADPWGSKDSYEIWLDPSAEGKKVVQLAFGVNGVKWGKTWSGDAQPGKDGWQGKVTRRADGWKAEVTVPYAALKLAKPKTGDHWRFNTCRTYHDNGGSQVISSWAHVGSIFNRPSQFADLYFGTPEGVAAAQKAARIENLKGLKAELEAKGFATYFAPRVKALEDGAPAAVEAEIRDELVVLEQIRKAKGK